MFEKVFSKRFSFLAGLTLLGSSSDCVYQNEKKKKKIRTAHGMLLRFQWNYYKMSI